VAALALSKWAFAAEKLGNPVIVPQDLRFERGFVLLAPEPGRKRPIGVLPGPVSQEPLWQIAQWNSCVPLGPSDAFRGENDFGGSNAARSVRVAQDGTLTLAARASLEYGGRLRQSGEPWPHLLIGQKLVEPLQLCAFTAIQFSIEVQVSRCEPPPGVLLEPRRHAAQLLLFLTVQNLRRGSPTYGDFLWFGIPLFDSRRRHPPAYRAPDTASGKLIWTAPADVFTSQTPHDGGWCRFEADLRPLMLRAVAEARERGFLLSDLRPEEHSVAALSLGWELPGPFDVEAHMRRLQIEGKRGTAPCLRGTPSTRDTSR